MKSYKYAEAKAILASMISARPPPLFRKRPLSFDHSAARHGSTTADSRGPFPPGCKPEDNFTQGTFSSTWIRIPSTSASRRAPPFTSTSPKRSICAKPLSVGTFDPSVFEEQRNRVPRLKVLRQCERRVRIPNSKPLRHPNDHVLCVTVPRNSCRCLRLFKRPLCENFPRSSRLAPNAKTQPQRLSLNFPAFVAPLDPPVGRVTSFVKGGHFSSC